MDSVTREFHIMENFTFLTVKTVFVQIILHLL